MGTTIKGNFAADGETEALIGRKFTVLLGNETNANFGGGTVTVLESHDGENYTVDSTSFTASDSFSTKDFAGGVNFKLKLSGSTSPNLDYSITYE